FQAEVGIRDLTVTGVQTCALPILVQVEQAKGGGFAYTRAGNLAVNRDGELCMANDQGRRIEPAITIPDNAEKISIASDGKVSVKIGRASCRERVDSSVGGAK